MAKDGKACATCRYAVSHINEQVLTCHRYPPLQRQFPIVLPLEWCGEYLGGKRP